MDTNELLTATVIISFIAMIISAASFAASPVYRRLLKREGRNAAVATPPADVIDVAREDEQARQEVERAAFHQAIEEYRRGYDSLIKQVEALGQEPVWRPNGKLKQVESGQSPMMALYDLITQYFNDEELDDLAFRLNIQRGELQGATTSRRAQSLVLYCQRRGMMRRLATQCKRLRPFAPWPDVD
jgi:hypothetical protein